MADRRGGAIDGRASGLPQPCSATVEDTKFGDYTNIHQGDQHVGQSNIHIVYHDYGARLPYTGDDVVFNPHDDQPNASYWTVPFGRNKDFIGREPVLDRLLEMIPPHLDKDDCQRTAIEGLGGVGKTQIALEAAFRVRDKYRDCHVFWVPAIDVTTFENAYRDIGRKLKIPGIDDDKADVKLLVRKALSQTTDNWLLIIDNADDADLFYSTDKAVPLSDSLPFNFKGSILFTTRNNGVSQKLDIRRGNVVSLTELSRPEAVDMLQKGLSPRQISNTASAMSLLDFLSDLPLAIKQASAYMVKTGIGVTQYLEHCRSSDERLIELLSKDFEDRARYKGAQNPVATTWLISFTAISRDMPLAAKYLQFMSFLAEKDIPKHLLPLDNDELETFEAIGVLKSYAFISERPEINTYDMHRLVRLVIQNWLAKEGQLKSCVTAVMQRLHEVYPSPDHGNRSVWARYLPHALTALEFQNHLVDKTPMLRIFYILAESLYLLGKYKQAEKLSRRMLELQRKIQGLKHHNTLSSINNLANMLYTQGEYNEAEQLLQQTLELHIEHLGPEHPSTLSTLNNFASMLYTRRKYEEAEQLFQQILELRTKVLGAEHPNTLFTMNTFARVLYKQSKHGEATELFRKTLDLQIKVLGAEHPDTLFSMQSFARVLYKQGKYNEAGQLFQQTLQLQIKHLGVEHPDTLLTTNNMAAMLYTQGKYKEAEELFQQTLKLRVKVLGAEHPDTLLTMNNFASILYAQDNFEESEKLFHQVLGLRIKVLGAEHLDTLVTMNALALARRRPPK